MRIVSHLATQGAKPQQYEPHSAEELSHPLRSLDVHTQIYNDIQTMLQPARHHHLVLLYTTI